MNEDYSTHWGQLREAINLLLSDEAASGQGPSPSPATHKISFEETYSAVYKCVCNHQAERLHADLMTHISGILSHWRGRLQQHHHQQQGSGGDEDMRLVQELDTLTTRFMQALPVIVPIFNYMNRFYIASKLRTDLQTLLLSLYAEIISDAFAEKVVSILSDSRLRPFSIPPATMTSLISNLHKVNPSYSQINPPLFSAYLTGINPPMVEADLEAQRQADLRLQENLRQAGFNTSDQSRKRGCPLAGDD